MHAIRVYAVVITTEEEDMDFEKITGGPFICGTCWSGYTTLDAVDACVESH